ncbi:calcium/sodium antiporter [Halorubrum ejinorense]|uniref:Calcium/sodium antiporter n=1 Tax=Halorubrum ejinorense TaxID=425309 RepID=A0AAV3SPR4_9EURY
MASTTAVAVDLALISGSVAALWLGAERLVGSATRIAQRLGVSDLVIGLSVVAIGTSAPEFAVTVDAALTGRADIAVGNVVGSNLFNLGFILGGVAMTSVTVAAAPEVIRRDGTVLVGGSLLVLGFLRDLELARWEGAVLVGLLVAYLVYLFVSEQSLKQETRDRREFRRRDVALLLVGLGLVVGGGRLLVGSAADLARAAGLSEWVIGVTVVAAGTSTPELATSVVAARRGSAGVTVGNLIGSDLFNLLGVLGLAAIIRPPTVASTAIQGLLWVTALVLVALAMLWSEGELTRPEGALLVGIAAVRWALDLAGLGPSVP